MCVAHVCMCTSCVPAARRPESQPCKESGVGARSAFCHPPSVSSVLLCVGMALEIARCLLYDCFFLELLLSGTDRVAVIQEAPDVALARAASGP